MLLGNYTSLNSNPGRNIGGFTNPYDWMKLSNTRKFYLGDAVVTDITNRSGFPNGYRPPYSWALAPKEGGMSIINALNGVNTISYSNLAGGVLGDSTFVGTSDLVSDMTGIGYIISSLTSSSDLTSDITGAVEMAATLANAGDLVGALGAMVDILATLTQDSTLSGDMVAALSAVATLTSTSDLTGAITGAVEMVASLTSSSTLTADVIGVWNMIATLTGSNTLASDIIAVAYIIADITNISGLDLIAGATPAYIDATISNVSELSPENLAAAVWNSIASSYNLSGTMGELLNASGGGSSPAIIAQAVWDELKATHTDPDSYGKIVQDLEAIAKQIKALTAAGL